MLIVKVQMCCQILKVPAYGPVNRENQMFTHKRDKGSHLLYIDLLLLFPVLLIFSVNFISLGFICYYTASNRTLFWLKLLHASYQVD